MRKRLLNKKWVGSLIFTAVCLLIGTTAVGVDKLANSLKNDVKAKSDLVTIDHMKIFGKLERPAVLFQHDLHTQALEEKNQDCSACHKSIKEKLSQKFMRLEDTDQEEIMNVYHNNCIGCHEETLTAGAKTGPVTCGECHMEDPTITSSRQPMGMDKSLHYKHTKSLENKCEQCHHIYNKETKKLVYEKEKEGTCRYCHKKETEENRISMALASHETCIGCHMKAIEEKKDAGPVKCRGCHDSEAQLAFEKIVEVPRMDRKQPDFLMIKTGNQEVDTQLKTRMNLVPFDHKAHEEYNDTCRVCHHGDISPCSKCHTLEGSEDADMINLEQAMHKTSINQSCIGCHNIKKQDKNCAGCHAFLEKNRKQDDAFCLNCHMNKIPMETEIEESGTDEAEMAGMLISSRQLVTRTYNQEDIPEKVVIKQLAKKYEPVEFPHRKVVNTIVDNIKDNKLATYFHTSKGTVCQGCHHNSPPNVKPPKCTNCHNQPFNEKDLFKPGILAAYHIQCMECHTNMEIDKVGCTDCHEEKK